MEQIQHRKQTPRQNGGVTIGTPDLRHKAIPSLALSGTTGAGDCTPAQF